MATNKTTAEKIAEQRTKMEQIQNEINRLLRLEKEEARKARTHRLCERGGIVEKLLPDLIRLNKEQFDTFVQKTLLSGYAEKILRELVSPEQPKDKTDIVQSGKTPAAKPAQTTATSDGADGSGTEDAARQAG